MSTLKMFKCAFDGTPTNYEQDLPGGKTPLCRGCYVVVNAKGVRSSLPAHHTITHPVQLQLLELAKDHDFRAMTLRQIGSLVGVDHQQQVKHHLLRLVALDHLEPDTWKPVTTTFAA